MKIKASIYLIAAIAGVLALFLGPRVLGPEIGLALGFVLLLFGVYGISRSVKGPRSGENQEEDG